MSKTRPDDNGDDSHDDEQRPIRVLFVRVPRCPSCGSHRLLSYRSTKHGEVKRVRYAQCEQCGQKVHLNIS